MYQYFIYLFKALSPTDDFLISCILGFIISAISPAVVVSAMFSLKTDGYGAKKGIPSMIIASAVKINTL